MSDETDRTIRALRDQLRECHHQIDLLRTLRDELTATIRSLRAALDSYEKEGSTDEG